MSDVELKEPLPIAPTPPPVPPLLSYKLQERDFVLDEAFVFGYSSVVLPLGVPFEDTLRPEFWAHVAWILKGDPSTGRQERRGQLIRVRAADFSFCGELFVRAVSDASVVVGVYKEPVYFGTVEHAFSRRYEVRWNIGKKGFDVIRKSDRAIIAGAEKFPVREQAEAWIAELEDQRAA